MAAAVTPAALWAARRPTDWLLGYPPEQFAALVQQQRRQLAQRPTAQPLLLLCESEPSLFLATCWAAGLEGWDVAIANPAWQAREWQQASAQLRPDRCQGKVLKPGGSSLPPSPVSRLLIPTGGTSGRVRFVIHTWQTLAIAAQGFIDYFGSPPASAYCVLPLHHVSGLMQALRSWISGGQLIVQPFRELQLGKPLISPTSAWFISLVPTQLQRLLAAAQAGWLAQFRAILLGGAPAWPQLLQQAASLPVALTYGMTETAAQIATLKPAAFRTGSRSSGQVLPHAQVDIQNEQGESLAAGQIGQLAICSAALAGGYVGQPIGRCFYPDDLGYFDRQGELHIVGRRSQKIITGGENVFPAEVEAAIWATQQVSDVCVVGLPDPDWGQRVTALYVPISATVTPSTLAAALSGQISRYKQPKRWQAVAALPRNAQGKIDRQQIEKMLS
ncbi:MAG: AMP-binding protein [Leptolyngbya sp. SIO4C1]|nr:AMP-binding protein [Leptolyngbya sp. SIO4C1]